MVGACVSRLDLDLLVCVVCECVSCLDLDFLVSSALDHGHERWLGVLKTRALSLVCTRTRRLKGRRQKGRGRGGGRVGEGSREREKGRKRKRDCELKPVCAASTYAITHAYTQGIRHHTRIFKAYTPTYAYMQRVHTRETCELKPVCSVSSNHSCSPVVCVSS